MKEWKDDKTLITLIKAELYTAVIGDIMDKMGYLHQFLPPHIRPLRDDMLIAGRAMTVLEADVHDNSASGGNNPLLQRSFGLMLEALDDLKEDEVYICSGSSPEYALWGELMSARAMQCKAAGAVVNGYSRDTFLYFLQYYPFTTCLLQCTGKNLFFYPTRNHTYTVNIPNQHITIIDQNPVYLNGNAVINNFSTRSLILRIRTIRETRKV